MALTPGLLFTSAMFTRSLAEAEYLLGPGEGVEEIAMWLQSWSSTSCGHGGIGGQAFTTGIVVAVTTTGGRAFFFSQGRILHNRENDHATAWAINNRHIPGKGEPWTEPTP